MKALTPTDFNKIQKLNIEFSLVEEKIYNLAKLQNQIALKKLLEKEDGIFTYEVVANISFYTDKSDYALVSWNESFRHHFLHDTRKNINDGKNHNSTSSIITDKELNSQEHCWLLYRLYGDFNISWTDILRIHHIMYSINISYQYQIDINL